MTKEALRAEAVSRLSHNPDFKIYTEIIRETLEETINRSNIESTDKAHAALSFILGLKTVLDIEEKYKNILKKMQMKGRTTND